MEHLTERKPPFVRHEDWIERQIREAQERGAFDGLPGAGKPLRRLGPLTPEEWARKWIEREGGSADGLLHPMLLLRKERAAFLESLDRWRSEAAVSEAVEDFNTRLLAQYRRPSDGPLIPVGVLDLEEVLLAWREARPPEPPPPDDVAPPRRRWWQWFR